MRDDADDKPRDGEQGDDPNNGEDPISLLVRNISRRVNNGDLKYEFSRIGEIADVYMPRNHYTHQPRGFGFIKYVDNRDARRAIEEMNGVRIDGREIQVCLAQEKRKTPDQMRDQEQKEGGPPRGRGRGRGGFRGGDRRGGRRSRSPPRGDYGRRYRGRSRSRSPPPRRGGYRSRDDRDSYRPRRSSYDREDRGGSRDRSPPRGRSRSPPRGRSRSPPRGRSRSRSN